MNIDLSDAEWLVSSANEELAGITWPADILQLTAKLRKRLTQTQARLLCELVELRHRGRAKFTKADEMFFVRDRLEQATDELIAHYKAARFESQPRIIDLCCGIGGDAIALAKMGDLSILDCSDSILRLAEANLSVYETKASLIASDVRAAQVSDYSAWHIDPDRRVNKKRKSDPEFCEPSLSEILEFTHETPNGAIKLAPSADATSLLQYGVELEWIGHDRECQQQVAWFGDLAKCPGKRTASWLQSNDVTVLVELPSAGECGYVDRSLRFIYEPRASVLAADLANTLAAEHGLQQLGQTSYFTADACVDSHLMSAFEVLADMAYHRDALLKELRRQDLHVTEVKKRRVSVDPNAVLNELHANAVEASAGASPVTLLFYSIANSIRVAIARRA